MAYIVPQALVYQEFTRVPSEITAPLRACVVGGNAQLIRYAEADEKSLGSLGEYDPTIDEAHLWPNRSAGAKVDTGYVKLFIDDALLHYYEKNIGVGGTVTPVSGKTNRIRSSAVGFTTNTASYPRSAAFLDRDVAVGDVVRIRGVVDSESIELWTYVRGFAYETVASVISDAESASTNLATQVEDYTVTQVAGDENCVTMDADLSGYDGLADGGVNDTYTFEVIDGSVDGDYTTAVIRVTTASGNDDVSSFSPGADGVAKAVGARGLEVTFTSSGFGSSCSADVGESVANELLPGQKWTLAVESAFTAPEATAAGAYTGTIDTIYIIEVTRGGRYDASVDADFPQITVSTVHGTDITAPKLILADSTNYTVGTKGVQVSFSATDGLRKGDKYLIPVTAAKAGRTSTLILGNDLGDLVDATDLDLDLYIKADIQVDHYRDSDLDTPNWETSATEITVNAGITATHSSWTDDGVEQPLDVMGGDIYVEYRAWLPAAAAAVNSVTGDADGVSAIPGPLSPDNPLKYGVYCAYLNANGTSVKYIGVTDPDDLDAWTASIDKLVGRTDVYNIVPMSHNAEVLNYVAGHVNSQSSATAGRWRAAVFGLEGKPTVALVTAASSTDEETVLATLGDDPDTSDTQYTLLTVPAGNGQFVVNGVAAGDIVRFLYSSDGLGNETYTEFEIDEVLSEDSVRLVTGHTVAITTAQKIEIWRNRTAQQEAEAIALEAGSYGSTRVLAVWPDYGMIGDTQVDSMYIAAMVAGRRSGVAPHQGLTNIALTGLDSVARTTSKFNADQLNAMAAGGAWIITQDPETGAIYTRHAVTTAGGSLSAQEEMIRTNVDSISYLFLQRLAPFIGVTNVTPTAIAAIETEIASVIGYLKSVGKSPNLGPQLIAADITRLEQSPVAADRVIAVLDITVPAPLNNLELYLVI